MDRSLAQANAGALEEMSVAGIFDCETKGGDVLWRARDSFFKRLYLTVGNTASTSKTLRGILAVLAVLLNYVIFI